MFVLLYILSAAALAQTHVKTVPATKLVVNLDLPPSQRWSGVVEHFGGPAAGTAIADYFNSLTKFIPKAALKLLQFIAGDVDKYAKGIPKDLREEMKALAVGLNMDLGMVVALNFLYELRWLAPPANSTGPCPKCAPPHTGACTSIVATDATTQSVEHARNMDWNLPNNVRNLTFHGVFQSQGKTVYEGACFVGYVGMASSFKAGGFGVTIDERDRGGDLIIDAIVAVIEGAADPTHLLRHVFSTATTYAEALSALSSTKLAAPAYYIVSGPGAKDGAVLTRERDSVKSTRTIGEQANGATWYALQTNYDWDEKPPTYDDRRKYALQYMNELGSASAVNEQSMFKVISTEPVMNNHTSYTTMMNVKTGDFKVFIRFLEQ